MFYRGLGISQTTVKKQIIAGAFICFSHLTDQVAISDRRLINSSQKSGMKMSKLCQLLCEFSGILVIHLLQVKLLRGRKRFSQPALATVEPLYPYAVALMRRDTEVRWSVKFRFYQK